jgi:predicted nucleotidyltransferase component of viral defense system
MIGDDHQLTPGYVARHLPPGSNADRGIALLDISQDFLLAHLQQRGLFDEIVVLKGGTAIRKLFAGPQGRFSTDLDLAAREPNVDPAVTAELIATESRVTLGPFQFTPLLQRGRWSIAVSSEFGDPVQRIKLDVGPPCWTEPEVRAFVPHPTHPRYRFQLPSLPTMRLEELLAEKVARLSRRSTARDAFDLVWAATTTPHSQFARADVRRMAVLKTWVDNLGMQPGWSPAIAPAPFDVKKWFSPRDNWDDEQIGLLARPAPALPELERNLHRLYEWLRELTPDEVRWATAGPRDRADVIRAIQTCEHAALADVALR